MKLIQQRIDGTAVDTLGLLYVDGKFFGFTLEDERREVKVKGETRIPAGTYELGVRYSPKLKREAIQIKDVPNFEWVMFHAGNTEADTEGCVLVGYGAERREKLASNGITSSKLAILDLENLVISKIKAGIVCMLEVRNEMSI
jgi:hypothetical protein